MFQNDTDTLSYMQTLFIRENRLTASTEPIDVAFISPCTICMVVWISLLQQIAEYLDIGFELPNFTQKFLYFTG
jgi:hypothetical protein